ncbi:hypothetical protein BJF85_01895 [Saccharomonospora sp. CUA-673]|uniref:hypothetical protein n=1 Tax=Saccharomonospora sp. CUA-673 TaxID=1904969 RepID=UPI00095A0AF5|nr:hypothetical protein [Saccharomonospora sp. CUA-673]OLT45178.1 hypothetical protein BJF85_01895 [Saccharomonospora sp. CUA-673]
MTSEPTGHDGHTHDPPPHAPATEPPLRVWWFGRSLLVLLPALFVPVLGDVLFWTGGGMAWILSPALVVSYLVSAVLLWLIARFDRTPIRVMVICGTAIYLFIAFALGMIWMEMLNRAFGLA